MLIGRERERARLAELVASAEDGTAGCLVVRGEPGVGKTALLDDLVERACDAQVLRAQGFEAEAPLAFAGLHRLLRPLAGRRDQLPTPQARALRMVFGEEDGATVDPYLVAIASLTMLAAAAEERLVLCILEDAHWLDRASTEALLFCARRLDADRVLMVFSARDGAEPEFRPAGVPELVLTGLDVDAARGLLRHRLGASVLDDVIDRLVAETGGNALALLELPTRLTEDQLEGAAALPARLSLTARLEEAFLQRSLTLSPETRLLLVVASAADTGDVAVIRSAATLIGVRDDALDEAVASGLLAVDEETVRVRHPLVRSALYQAATDTQRRRVHLALADSLAAYDDFDRETWHRSAAAEGADQELADAIAHVGARAERRGGPAAALAAYERAATLATSELRRAELRLAAARTAWAAGQAARSRDLLSQITHQAADPLLLADAARLRGRIEVAVGSAEAAHRIFVEAVAALGEIDPARSLEMAVAAALLASYGADSGAELRLDSGLLEAATDGSARSTCLEQLFVAMTRTAEQDWSGAVAALDLAAAAGATVTDPDVLSNLGNAALQLGDDAVQQHFYGRGLSLARSAGAVTTVVYDLQRLCFGHLVAGDLTAVRACAEEAVALGDSVRARALTVPSLAWLALLDALQGLDDDERRARELDEVAGQSLGILQDPVHDLVSWAKGSRALGGSEPDHALHHFRQIRLPAITRMAALETIDAAARAGEPDVIRGLVEDLADFAQTTRRPWALATVAHGRAMTAGPAEAGALFDQALSHHGDSTRSLDRARTHLAYGEWLRRAQRRVDARTHLREALATFQDVRARPLDDRAASELRASGETARKRDPSTLLTLTPMELKVAQLVASGLSNKEVAAQCWVSPRTVGFHLRNVFAKAGITARGELARLDLG